MRLPESFTRAYEEELALIEPLRERAGTRLRLLAADNNWLFDDRIKSADSCLSKLEAGKSSLREMHDIYAAMLVVPTQKHVDSACNKILALFNGHIKAARNGNPSSFVYDDLHVIACLQGKISPRAVPHPAVLDRQFEIQIHTGVQYAWWRATHDDLYKNSDPNEGSWAAKRASGQARAALELVDGVLADFETAGQLQRKSPREPSPTESIGKWLLRWPTTRRPTDGIRFAATVSGIAGAAEINLYEIASLLDRGDLDPYLSDPRITAVQVIIVSCHIIGGDAIFQKLIKSQQQLLITDELTAVYPAIESAPLDLRVAL